jgi:hypothetical protein
MVKSKKSWNSIRAGLHYNGTGFQHTDTKSEAGLRFNRTGFQEKYELDRPAEAFLSWNLSWSPGEKIHFK